MKPRIQFALFTASSLLLCSCMTNVSHQVPFNQSVGQPLRTQRTTILYTDTAWESNAEMLFRPPKEALHLMEPPRSASDYRNQNRLVTLAPGQELRLVEVRQDVGDGIVNYDAIGEVYVPKWKRFVRFHHNWGYNGRVYRAPWESSNVPVVRQL